MKLSRINDARVWRFAELWQALALALCLLAIVASIPGLSRAMLSPLFSTIEAGLENEVESESPTEESSSEPASIGLIASRMRVLRSSLPNEQAIPLTSAFRRPGGFRVDGGDSGRCRGAAAQLALRC